MKNGRACLGFRPQRTGNCVNTVKTPPSQAVDMASPSSPHFSPEPCSLNPPDTLPCSDMESLWPTEDLPATPSAYLSTSHAPESLQCHIETLPCRPASGSSIELPTFSPVNESTFTWGSCDSTTFTNSLNAAYDEAVHRRPSLFKVPFGKAARLSFPNWQEYIKPLPRVLPWNPSL